MRLGEFVTTIRGVSYKPADLHQELDSESVVLLRANNIADGRINHDDVQYVDLTKVKGQQYLRRGDILVCASSGSKKLVGKAALVREDTREVFGAFCLALRPRDLVEPGYLGHYFQSLQYRNAIEEVCTGSNINNLKPAHFNELDVNIPDEDLQRDAVKRFDGVQGQIVECQTLLVQLDELVKSRFVEMFGSGDSFEQCTMDKLLSGIISGTNVSGNQRPLLEGEFAVLKISAVTKGWFKADEYKVVDDVSGIRMVHPRKGDLLFSRANTSEMVGATVIVDDDYDQLFLPDKLWRLDPAQGVDTVFLKHLLSSPQLRAEMSKVSTGTSGSMQNISMAKFRKLKAFLPPLDLQQEFAVFVQQVDKLKFMHLSKSIDRIEFDFS